MEYCFANTNGITCDSGFNGSDFFSYDLHSNCLLCQLSWIPRYERYLSSSIFPVKKYSSSYLMSKRYATRRISVNLNTELILKDLKLFKHFNLKRGSCSNIRRRRKIKTSLRTHYNVKSIVSSRQLKPKPPPSLPFVNRHNLIEIKLKRDFYQFPSILYSNLRSIANKFDQVEWNIINYRPDLAIFVETWMSDSTVSAYDVANYTTFNKIRNRVDKHHGGGIMAYVSNKITIQAFKPSPDLSLDVFTLILRPNLLPRSVSWIAIIVIYSPPNDSLSDSLKHYLIGEIDRLLALNFKASIYIIGDFNEFDVKFINNYTLFKQIISSPSRKDAFLDKCFLYAPIKYSCSVFPPIASSDHNMILLQPHQSSPPSDNSSFISYRPKKTKNILEMGRVLCDLNWNYVYHSHNIEEAACWFHSHIYQIYLQCFPLITKKVKSNTPPWFTDELNSLFIKRNLTFSKNSCDKLDFFNNRIKFLLRDLKKKWFEDVLSNCPVGSSGFYAHIKKLMGRQNKSLSITFPNKGEEESFNDSFNFFSSLANSHQPLNEIVHTYGLHSDIPLACTSDIYYRLSKMPSNSSSSPDGIPDFIWSEFAAVLADPVTSLINLSLLNQCCPSVWKNSTLITIPKISSPQDPSHLRPISLTSPLAKLCERYILSHILPTLSPSLDPFQFGGTPGKSSAQYLALYVHRALFELEDRSKFVSSLMLDFRKAYDNLDHSAFIEKLKKVLHADSIITWICSFLHNRHQNMKNPVSGLTLSFVCSNGVPQGSVLGSLIFAILVNDIAVNCKYHLKYVDDLTVTFTLDQDSVSHPQLITGGIVDQCREINMPINLDKSKLIVHDFHRKKTVPSITIDGVALQVVDHIRILGVCVQDDLRWNLHVDCLIRKANKSMFILYKLKRLGASCKVLLMTYISFIRSTLEYCAPVWNPALTVGQINSLESVQRRALKVIMGSEHIDYQSDLLFLGVDSLSVRRIKLSYDFSVNFFRTFPQFLPPKQGIISGRNTRGSNKLTVPISRTSRFRRSPILVAIDMLNSTPMSS